MATPQIRITARPEDFAAASAIEEEADELLIAHVRASDWPSVTSADERIVMPGFLLVAEDAHTPFGFAHVLQVDEFVHLEQLAVSPRHARQGYGRALVGAALAEAASRGYDEITLRTYRNVPFNAPFYASCGFRETEPVSPFHRHLVDVESRLGLGKYGERIQMTACLTQGVAGRRLI